MARAESQVPSVAVGPSSWLPGSTPAGPPTETTRLAVVTSSGDWSRSWGYDVSRSLVLSAGTSEPVSVIRSPTAVISRHPTEPGAVVSSKVISPAAMSPSLAYSQVMRVDRQAALPVADRCAGALEREVDPAAAGTEVQAVERGRALALRERGQVVDRLAQLGRRDLREVDDVVDREPVG